MKIGDKVRFLFETGGGIVKGFQGKDIALVEDENGFSIPMLYGRGLRYSATLSWRLSDSLNLSAKYALSNYADRTALSSGLNQISGNM